MTGSWAPWPTWVSDSRIRRWAIFFAAMIFHRLPSGSRRRVGRTLSVLTWGIGGDRLLHGGSAHAKRVDYVLRCCFSFIWRAGGYAWPDSPVIRIKGGWNRWRAM